MTTNDLSFQFKNKKFEDREAESKRILTKYPDRIPIILLRYSKNDMPLDKYKFLAPGDTTIVTLLYHIRKSIKLRPEQAIYLYINEELYNTSITMKEIYEKEKNTDGFIYITYSNENTFG